MAGRLHRASTERTQPALAEKVRALRDPAIYPNATRHVETIETHFAWVFLTDQHAYKLKKPMRVDRMDNRTLDARRRSCAEELRLNRRLAPEVYLEVVALKDDGQGALRLEGPGAPVEWLVKMQRLDEALLLDHAIRAGAATRDSVQGVSRLLAEFYCRQPPIRIGTEEYPQRLTALASANRAELLAKDLQMPADLAATVISHQLDFLRRHSPLIAERARRGKIVEAHGDLRPEHVYLGSPPCVIDSLEFDRDLRLLDPFEELAFLSVECARAGAAWIGEEVTGVYRTMSCDSPEPALFDFYLSQRAAYRAIIVAWHLRDPEVRDSKDWRALATTYLVLALQYASRALQLQSTTYTPRL